MATFNFTGFRPIEEVDDDQESLRKVWWHPIPKRPFPNWKVLAGIGFAIIILLSVNPLVGLAAIAGAGFYIYYLKKSNDVAIQATSLAILEDNMIQAIRRTVGQVIPDFEISQREFTEARDNGLLIWFSTGHQTSSLPVHIPLHARINVYVAILTNKGIAYLDSTYDTIANRFLPGQGELLLWNRIARVRREGLDALVIESTGGSKVTIPLDDTTVDNQNHQGFADLITNRVNPFVRAANRYLQQN